MQARTLLLSLAAVLFAAGIQAAVVDDFEAGVGAWTPDADVTLTTSTTGATSGTQSMQVDVAVADWKICGKLDAKAFRTLLGAPGATISMDVTVSPGEFTGTWMNVELVINAQNNDDNGPNNNVGWNPLGGQDLIRDGQPHTYTWALPADLIDKIAATDENIAWFELVIVTNTDASTRRFYVDTIQIPEPQQHVTDYPHGQLIGDFEDEGLDGWLTNDATFTRTNTGATRGEWALRSDIAVGGWHIHGRIDAKPYRELLAAGARIVMDVTAVADDQPGVSWMNVEMIVNGQNNDDAGPHNNIGWNPLGGQGVILDGEPHTYTWVLPSPLREAISHVDDSIWWFELMIVTNNDATATRITVDNIWLVLPSTAEYPDPQDGATGVDYIPVLSWINGAGAGLADVYFGLDRTAVADANADNLDQYPGVLYERSDDDLFEPGILNLSTSYYWRVDAIDVNDLTGQILAVHPGTVWSFTVAEYMTIDDFESYADADALLAAWTDANDLEATVAQDGLQSMKIVYDHRRAPFVTTASYDLPAHLADWTQQNLGSLELYFYGDPNNAVNGPEPLFVLAEDAQANTAVVFYDEDPAALSTPEWHHWQIPLREFAGIDRRQVARLAVGFGDPTNPGPGNTGILFVDTIRLYQGRCLLDRRTPEFARLDFAPLGIPGGDCHVDAAELMILANDWLQQDQLLPTSSDDPNIAGGGLVAYFNLDEGQGDTVASDANGLKEGTLYQNADWVSPGFDGTGSAVHFDGTNNTRIDIGTWDPSAGTGQLSLSAWIRWAGDRSVGHQGIIGKRDAWAATDAMRWFFETDPLGRLAFRQYWQAGVDLYSPQGALDPFVGQWAHVAVTFDGTTATIYLNGAPVASGPFTLADKADARIGIGNTHGGGGGEVFVGDIDEVQIYNRALSPEEIAYLADPTPGDGQLHVPVPSKANLVDIEPEGQQAVNLADFAALAEAWLTEQMWP